MLRKVYCQHCGGTPNPYANLSCSLFGHPFVDLVDNLLEWVAWWHVKHGGQLDSQCFVAHSYIYTWAHLETLLGIHSCKRTAMFYCFNFKYVTTTTSRVPASSPGSKIKHSFWKAGTLESHGALSVQSWMVMFI